MLVLAHTVRNEIDHVETGHALLVQVIDRVRVLLAEDSHQHVDAVNFLLAGRLHVVDRALEHALETQRRLSIALVAGRQHRHGFEDDRFQILAELGGIGAAGAQHRRRRRIFEQGQQQMLDGHELVALLARLLVALADGELEIFTEHLV